MSAGRKMTPRRKVSINAAEVPQSSGRKTRASNVAAGASSSHNNSPRSTRSSRGPTSSILKYGGQPANEENDQGTFQVEKVLDRQIAEDDRLFYQIKWSGYDETTWEPVYNLNCPQHLKNFEEGLKSGYSKNE